jgi:succinylglutamate desuccinylase
MAKAPELTKTKFDVRRIIGKIEGKHPGPCIIFFGSIHGNETSGYLALKRFFDPAVTRNISNKLRGTIIGITGNIKALNEGKRFIEKDLNRIWTHENLARISKHPELFDGNEYAEMRDLYAEINNILTGGATNYYFIDLHTTSGSTLPFVIINDSLQNRALARFFPTPVVLGIEEYLEGTIMDYINDLGFPAIAMESGQHDDMESEDIHFASVWVALVAAGCLKEEEVRGYKAHCDRIRFAAVAEKRNFYEVVYREPVNPNQEFVMNNGYSNFHRVAKGETLAHKNKKEIIAEYSGRIFMPLYQSQGSEGFFIIRKINKIWLRLSRFLRKNKLEYVFTVLPGIQIKPEERNVLIVNKKIAAFFSTDLLHLFGYRKVRINGSKVEYVKREIPQYTQPYYLKTEANKQQ